jgi:hypothetical protein
MQSEQENKNLVISQVALQSHLDIQQETIQKAHTLIISKLDFISNFIDVLRHLHSPQPAQSMVGSHTGFDYNQAIPGFQTPDEPGSEISYGHS